VLVTLTGAVVAIVYYHYRVDEEIRAVVEAKFAEHYPGLEVSVGAARLVEGEGIEIRDLSIAQPGVGCASAELVRVEEILLSCQTDPQDLLQNHLDIRHATVRRMKLRFVRGAGGGWSAASLWPLPKFGDDTPTVTIEDGTVEIIDPNTPGAELVLRQLQLTATPRLEDRPTAPSPAESADRRPLLAIRGSLAGDHFERIELNATLDPDSGQWSTRGQVVRLDVSPELHAAIRAVTAACPAELRSVSGRADLKFHLEDDPTGRTPCHFAVSGDFSHGRIADPRLPYPLTDVRAGVRFDNHGIRVDNLTARHGQATLALSLATSGFASNSPLVLKARASRLSLDENLVGSLPRSLQSAWGNFMPKGAVDVQLTLQFDGQTWKTETAIKCLDVSLQYHKLPYRVEHGVGTIHLRDNVLNVDLSVLAGEIPVRIKGRIVNPGPKYTGELEFESDGPIPIDEKLLCSLDGRAQRVVRAFRPRGWFAFSAATGRSDAEAPRPYTRLVVHLQDCSIRYDKFRYPIQRIRGTLRMTGREWSFRDLKGFNDSGFVTCTGNWIPAEPNGGELSLDFRATDVALEDELRDALGAGAQRVWAGLRPRGTLDRLDVSLRYRSWDKKLDIDVWAEKWPTSQNVEGRSVSIEPVWFPYRMDQLIGSVHYRNGHVELNNLRATHGRVQLAAGGRCEVRDDGHWQVRLENLTAERLSADRDLIAALPSGLDRAVAKLNLSGPVSVRGALQLEGSEQPDDDIQTNWDLALDVENASINCGIRIDHLYGGVRLVGNSNAARFYSRGELAVDSLMYQGLQFTRVSGPLSIDRSGVTFGAWADQHPSQQHRSETPRQITGHIFGGVLGGDAQLTFDDEGQFAVQGVFRDGDLSLVARETMPQQQNISGKVLGAIYLGGTYKGIHTLRGGGKVRLSDADIYELPLMVQLLKILRLSKPDKTAFTSSDIHYRIEGDRIVFDRIVFNGDAISLIGKGSVRLDRKIENMDFYTIMGRDERSIPILRPVLGEASRQLLLIRVAGTLDNPRTSRDALPLLNETLQQLFPEEARIRQPDFPVLPRPREVLQRTGLLPRR